MKKAHVPVEDIANGATGSQSADHGERKRGGRQAQTDSANVDDGLEPFAQDSDERQEEHGVFLGPLLEAHAGGGICVGARFGIQGLDQLDAPLVLELVHAEKRSAHDRDDDGGDDAEDALPDVLGVCKMVFAVGVEGADHACANANTDKQSKRYSKPNLKET